MTLAQRTLAHTACCLALLAGSAACAPRQQRAARFEARGPACDAHQKELVSFTERLPERALSRSLKVTLPESTVGELPGSGRLLEISESDASLDGETLPGASLGERVARLRERLSASSAAAPPKDSAPAVRVLYVAGAADLDVQTLRAYLDAVPESMGLRWLVRMPAPPASRKGSGAEAGQELAVRLLAEHDPAARRELFREGYAEFSRCQAVADAVASVGTRGPEERWPALRSALLTALPRCDCSELDSQNLEQLLLAEQRAGSATLAALPLGFLRDARCGASMPLRSLQKLSTQIEEFDREFSGQMQEDAIRFEKVITDERLLNTFCNALPGETLAAFAKARATLYWRLPNAVCEAWRFEPLSPGAPMGTWRRVGDSEPGLAFHYWQAAEELKIFGPLSAEDKTLPTDHREWACEQNQRLTGIDAHSIQLEQGRWFFSETACRAASESDALAGCSSERRAK